jgi:hypothetical protein
MTFDPTRDNRLRHVAGQKKGHVESYFLKLNSPDGARALWLKLTVFSPEGRPDDAVGEVWAISFSRGGPHVAVRQSYGLRQLGYIEVSPGELAVGPARLGPGFTWGAASHGGHQVQWNLNFTTGSPPLHPFPSELMYETPLPRSKLLSPYPDETFEGSYTVDGTTISVDGWRGMQGHNWGSQHAFLYAWGHCNTLQDERGQPVPGAMFEGASASVQLGPGGLITTPLLTVVCLRLPGVAPAAPGSGTELRFNNPSTLLSRSAEIDFRSWHFEASRSPWRLSGRARSETANMVGLYYPNPDGPMTYCLNSKLADLELTLEGPGGRRRLTSQTSALEIATREPGHGVTMAV